MLTSVTRMLRLLRFITWNLASTRPIPPLVKPTKVTFTSGAVIAPAGQRASIATGSITSTQARISGAFRMGPFNHLMRSERSFEIVFSNDRDIATVVDHELFFKTFSI